LPLPAGAAAYSGVTLGAGQLRTTASGRLEDALGDMAGLASFRRTDSRSANPTSQGLTLRALGGNAASRALVLLDGVPLADPFAGWLPFAAVDPARLAAARLVRGGGGGAFGNGAVAGTLDLVSAGPESLSLVSGAVFYGSRDSVEAQAGLAAALGGGFVTASFRHDEGDGAFLVRAEDRGPVDIQARYRSSGGSLRIVLPAGDETEVQAGFRGFVDARTRGVEIIDSGNSGADASLRLVRRGDRGGAWGVDALAYVQTRVFSSRFASIAAGRAAASPVLDQFRTPATGVGARLEVRPPVPFELQLGVDWRRNTGVTNERFRFVGGEFDGLREAGATSHLMGVYGEASFELGTVVLTGGGRVDRWRVGEARLLEQFASGREGQALVTPGRSGTEVTARGGFVWKPVPAFGLRGALYRGFRLPTLNELVRPFRVGPDATAANPDLGLERADGVEAGFDWRPLPAARLGVTVFANRLNGAIANVTLARGPGVFPQVGFVSGAGVFRQRLNLDRIDTRGIEVDAGLEVGRFTGTFSAAYADARVRDVRLDGLRPAQSPDLSVAAGLGYASDGFGMTARVRYVAAAFEDDLNVRELPGVVTVDMSARLALGRGFSVVARAENLTDSEVVSGISSSGLRDLGQPRTLWLGVSFSPGG